MAYFYIEIEDGAPITFQVVTSFKGSIIKCYNPVVDYGLVKVNTSQTVEIEIENESPIMADIMIKNSVNDNLNFDNMISMEEVVQEDLDPSVIPLIYDKHYQTSKSNILKFDAYCLQMQPHEVKKVRIELKSFQPEHLCEFFEIMVKDGSSQFFKIMSEIQCPHVSLNRVVMNLGRIYAGVTEYVNPQSRHQK